MSTPSACEQEFMSALTNKSYFYKVFVDPESFFMYKSIQRFFANGGHLGQFVDLRVEQFNMTFNNIE